MNYSPYTILSKACFPMQKEAFLMMWLKLTPHEPLASSYSCAGLFVSFLLRNHNDRFSCDEAHIFPCSVHIGCYFCT